MKHSRIALALVLLCGTASAETNGVITTAAELTKIVSRKGPPGHPFRIRATALSQPRHRRFSFFVLDETGGAVVFDIREGNDPPIAIGDRLVIEGIVEPRHRTTPEDMLRNANCTNIIVLSHGRPPKPKPITVDDIERNELLSTPVSVDGILVDVRKDEIDPRYALLVLDCSNRMAYAAAYIDDMEKLLQKAKRMIGATVRIYGVLHQHIGSRAYGRRLISMRRQNDIEMLTPPSDMLFQAPEIGDTENLSPDAIAALGRRKAVGRVLAAWNGDTILLRTDGGDPMKVCLATQPPKVGDVIEVVGYAETDLFHVNLARAVWRRSTATVAPEPPAKELSAKDLLVDAKGNRKFNVARHGDRIRLRGIVQNVHSDGNSGKRLILDADGHMVAVDCSAAPEAVNGPTKGCTVSVTGVCVLETESWNLHTTLPRTTGLFIALRDPSDVKIVALPPWWTPARLMAVIGGLLLLLAAITAWNLSLRALSERRGHALYLSQMAQAQSELRKDERTRLAAELHDHLAQNLTAISYQVAAADRAHSIDPDASARHLSTAARMLGSSRTELRRCIWDLRCDALDEPDFSQAIHRSIEQVVGEAEVEVHADLPRGKISDQTVHAVLSIIRELVANSVNHGHAGAIRIDGGIADGRVVFSVKDDGCGFDAEHAPGPEDGHFGLDGIRERLRRHQGEMKIESSSGKGTDVSFWLLPGREAPDASHGGSASGVPCPSHQNP